MKAKGLSNVGKVRQNNEDNFLCAPDKNLFIVADGLGGHSAGEVASEMAVDHVSASNPKDIEDLVEYITQANAKVYQEARTIHNDMATTISALLISNDKAFIGHVGDSRVYLVRKDSIYPITEDHTPVMESLRAGLITEEQARFHPLKHMLSRTIGTHINVEVDSLIVDIEANDTFVLCTDGLSNLVDEDEILEMALGNKEPEKITEALVEKALERGGLDNVTVVCVQVEEADIKVEAAKSAE